MIMISVIVPVYNAGKYLRRCIDSILAQTYTDFELLLIDDGSTDDSPDICDEYVNKCKWGANTRLSQAQRRSKFCTKPRIAACTG